MRRAFGEPVAFQRSIMSETCKAAVQSGIEYIAFGDLFLTDIRAYREKLLESRHPLSDYSFE